MTKKFFLISLLFLCFLSANIYAEQVEISGLYGGTLSLNCSGLNDTEYGGGECTMTYNDFSIIKGYVYNGTLNITYSVLTGKNQLWIDFQQGSSFKITGEGTEISVYFPETISFELSLETYRCEQVVSSSGKQPYILINNKPLPVSTDIFQYLIHL